MIASESYTVETFNPDTVAEVCRRNGVCLIKGFFDANEMQRIQDGLVETDQRFGSMRPDPLSCPSLNWLLVHPRICDVAKMLLGDDLVYYTNGSINYEAEIGPLTNTPYTALHSDAAGNPQNVHGNAERNTEEPFPAYRFAIYMQDYTNSSGGVRVAPGSHLWTTDYDTSAQDEFSSIRIPPPSNPDAKPEEFIDIVPTRPGDLVIWNIALIHGAGAKRLKNNPKHCLHPREEAALTRDDPTQFLPAPGPRNAVFFDYGAVCEQVDLYIKFYTQTTKEKRLIPFGLGRSDDPATESLITGSGAQLREDGLIVSLSVQIEKLKNGGDAETIRSLVKRHREYSTHHALFDRTVFEALDLSSWKQAVGYAQQHIIRQITAGARAQ
ncbi:MAG: hypothetical protein HN793_01005 [Rhodospirillaceae bacterium]|jgi:hypothetical protein|nr:hypothetical protein [Rhodospirillaceae bacterium]MBT5240206.1 hypothetical protein [Rhodospirillaceae bacterium]MBT5566985.1 hypothetical protein [Rhodospirillaceae bacterium]MBT6090328.1 hypothetical protein [Rhodospirillaceae bacterium]MBT6961977.1 hypothetical protein [Rhodospirillaceae bacterium]